jgi:hypothetical protein
MCSNSERKQLKKPMPINDLQQSAITNPILLAALATTLLCCLARGLARAICEEH